MKRDNLVADIEALGNVDASEIHARRLNAKKYLTAQRSDIFIFPIAEGQAKLCGRDHGAREPALTREQIAVSEDLSEDFQGSSEKFIREQPVRSEGLSSETSQPIDDAQDDAKARNDFWSIEGDVIYRRHVVDGFPRSSTDSMIIHSLLCPKSATVISDICTRQFHILHRR